MLRRIPLLVTALALAATAACTASTNSASEGPGASSPKPAVAPTLTVGSERASTVPWTRPLSLAVVNGTLQRVTALGPDGLPLEGTLTATGWTSTTTLIPSRSYRVTAVVKDANGESRTLERTLSASGASKVLHATISPGPGAVVGVAQPVIVRFDQKVTGRAARLAVMQRLNVVTTPAVEGAWRWYNSYEAHYHAEKYWTSGTKIAVTADLSLLNLPGTGTWGATKAATSTITVGKNYSSLVDLKAHTMVVTLDGKVIRRMKISGGSTKYPTKGGVHIVLNREKVHLFNSATVGIPTNSPEGYYKKLPWSVRISNGGAFVHSQPGSIRSQGFRNVSHGCVNANPTDAEWFYYHSQLGDPVNIINAVVKPTKWDAGMADWNYTWAEWKAGNLDG